MNKPPKAKAAKVKLLELELGPLPHGELNRALGLELEPGPVVFTVPAQRHALQSHPNDFHSCLPFVALAVKEPSYAGDDFKNPGKIELIRRMPDKQGLLVAIILEPDSRGRYRVASMYPIPQKVIDQRRQAGRLKIV